MSAINATLLSPLLRVEKEKNKKTKEEKITSTSNPFVKHCVKLRQSSSYRRSIGSALVVGLTPIMEICRFQKSQRDELPLVDCLLLLEGAETPKGLVGSYDSLLHVSPNVMKKLSGVQSVDSIEGIALIRIPKSFCDMDMDHGNGIYWSCLSDPHRILVLDRIQDPGNLGTLLRSAMAFNWDGVFLLSGCCDPFNEKALRAARGASFQLPLISGNWSHLNSLRTKFEMKILAGHPGNWSEGDQKGPSALTRDIADSLAHKPLCLVLGSEGNGLSIETMESCELVSIPMAALGLKNKSSFHRLGSIIIFCLMKFHNEYFVCFILDSCLVHTCRCGSCFLCVRCWRKLL